MGKKQKKKGPQTADKVPTVLPVQKCHLRLMRLERVKDLLLIEEEFLANQETGSAKPREEKEKEERSRVDELRGNPMSLGM